MKLSEQDAGLFFELMGALQVFVNQRLQVLPDVKTLDDYIDLSMEEKMQVREALYENIELIDAFVEENPRQFSQDKLDIVSKWKQFVAGDLFLERMLKKYAIFIASDNKVYGVLALYDAFQDMVHPGALPYRVKAVLLPFKGKIIYDGLLQGYNIYFGRGISTLWKGLAKVDRAIRSVETTLHRSERYL